MTGSAESPGLRAVLSAEEARIAAMAAGDLDTLAGLLADECVYVHSTGVIDTKESYLAKLADGLIRYISVGALDIRPLQLGSTVIVMHRMQAEAVVDGVRRSLNSRVASVWQVTDGVATLGYLQSTPLPDARQAGEGAA